MQNYSAIEWTNVEKLNIPDLFEYNRIRHKEVLDFWNWLSLMQLDANS